MASYTFRRTSSTFTRRACRRNQNNSRSFTPIRAVTCLIMQCAIPAQVCSLVWYFHALNQTVARGGNPYASPSLLRLASSSVGLELFFNSCSSSRNVTREGCPCCIVALRFSSLNLASPSSQCCTRFTSHVDPAAA